MSKEELDNLVKIGRLKIGAPARKEFEGMVKSARRGLTDAQNESIETDSQFDLACEAAHKFALAALRNHGYRSENRITVFQALVHTLGTNNADLQTFLKAHNERNLAAYEGRVDIDETLLKNLVAATKRLEAGCRQAYPTARLAWDSLKFKHSTVMAGLVPAIPSLTLRGNKTWMPGTRPGLTILLKTTPALELRAESSDIWLYATPILHASDAAAAPARRRVLQVDFSAGALPGGLEWLGI